ncbi:MAG: RIP metalloprotease RseP [Calditrichaceae bacterium]|nr:RIP metalloprotease RseP [Calditrichaceae bacterium]MBN2708842.1 RIP metalloprotease RseP [Calditrichaceae bacterium]RQV97631.1 MAG: RIP metalloprotease RseP [Calditrichota bacterium]
MLTILAIIFVFSVLVIVHELGHFLAAKWMGVRVEKFSIGFPPKLISKKIGETEFTFSAIPLGGYVKMSGFIDESMDTTVTGAPYEFNSKPVWKRIIIISGGVIMNLILAILILTILNFSQGEKILPTTTIGSVGETGIAKEIGFQRGDIILAINNHEINSWNEIGRQFLENLNKDIVFDINRGGSNLELIYKKEWFKREKGELIDINPLIPAKVGDVSSSMPAEKIGLQKGDEIVLLAGEEIDDWEEMTTVIRSHPEQEIDIAWERNNELFKAVITPKSFEQKDENGNIVNIGLIGITHYYKHNKIGFFRSIQNGITGTYDLIVLNMKGMWWVLTGTKSAKEVLGGPITIARMAGDAAEAGWSYLWTFIAGLSAILAFFNILPVPALDGGHLMVLIIEGITRKPLSAKVRIKIQQIGLAVILSLIVLVLYIDINRL